MSKSYKSLASKLTKTSILPIILLLNSCVTQKDLEYLQDPSKDLKAFEEADYSDYRLKPNDELLIQVSSLDEADAGIFSNSKEQTYYMGSMQPYGASMLSYSIDKEGYLSLPVVGSFHVQDKTLTEVSDIIIDSLSHILHQPMVSVKLVNRYVSVLGEVRSPGQFAYAQDRLSIYDALALAGDITIYGDREEVLLVRNIKGENIRVLMDLNDSNILASEYYYIRPNDKIFVKPMRKRFWGMDQFPYAVILSTITTALLIFTVVRPE